MRATGWPRQLRAGGGQAAGHLTSSGSPSPTPATWCRKQSSGFLASWDRRRPSICLATSSTFLILAPGPLREATLNRCPAVGGIGWISGTPGRRPSPGLPSPNVPRPKSRQLPDMASATSAQSSMRMTSIGILRLPNLRRTSSKRERERPTVSGCSVRKIRKPIKTVGWGA